MNMRQTGHLLLAVLLLAGCDTASSQAGHDGPAPRVWPSDLTGLVGDNWQGQLTYLDHGISRERVTLPVNLTVTQDGHTFAFDFTYPEKPEADARVQVVISTNGRKINDETVVRRIERSDSLFLVTDEACTDKGVEARCDHTYEITPRSLSMRKMVTLDGDEEAFIRNHYSFTR